jgi:hypothetical protein
MLLDPFEEQLNLPAMFVKQSNGQGINFKVAGYKNQSPPVISIIKLYSAKINGV